MATGLVTETYSVKEVAQILGWSERSIYDHVGRGDFPIKPLRLGRTVRFTKRSVDLLLASCDESVSSQ